MNKPPLILRLSGLLYRLLLLVYPKAFRHEYAEPMLQLFRDCCAGTYAEGGYPALAGLWWRTLGDLVATSLREHLTRARASPPVPSGLALPITPRAQRSLEIALREARAAGCSELSPEHVLLGLIGEGSGARIGAETGVAGYVLRSLCVSMNRARQAAALQQPSSCPPRPATDFGSVLICRAEAEARRLGHSFVGTEHFLLGLLGDHQPTVAAFFDSLGVSVEQVQHGTLRIIGASSKELGDFYGTCNRENMDRGRQDRA